MLRLKGVHNIIHGKELIASKPQHKGCFGHVLKCLAPDYRASIRPIELNIHLFAVRNGGQFSDRRAILRLCGISVRGQPNNDESDDQFDDFPHCRSFRVQRFSVSGIQPSSLAAVFAVPSKANIRHNSSTTIRSPLFGSDIGVHVEEVDE
jgi:hypothetical protein